MTNHRQLIQGCAQRLENHELGRVPGVMDLWRRTRWQEVSAGGRFDAQLSPKDPAIIRLYPDLLKSGRAEFKVLREFGLLVKRRAGPKADMLWERKLGLPTRDQIQKARQKLMDPELRRKARSYAQIKDSYPPKGSAVDRLVFIHLANALLANNIPLGDSGGIDILSAGPTTAYCQEKRYHSLAPLVSAYCPREIGDCYGLAFAEYVLDDLRACQESSVAEGLRRIIRGIAGRLPAPGKMSTLPTPI